MLPAAEKEREMLRDEASQAREEASIARQEIERYKAAREEAQNRAEALEVKLEEARANAKWSWKRKMKKAS